MILFVLGCGPEADPVVREVTIPLEGAPLARRLSIDLRGVVPTAAELAIAGDGGTDALVDQWLEDPRFEAHLVDAFVEDWMLHVDELRVDASEFGVDPDPYAFTRAFGSEPARLMARVGAEDRPWSEIVTADWTIANDRLAEMVPVEFEDPSDASEWRVARYTDGRPAGGVLMTSGLWMRYHTTLFNYNRARAAVLARYLLCYDFLSRPVSFSRVTGTSGAELQAATRTEPGCVSCHAGLDPLASSLFGFWPFEDLDGRELVEYHRERERYGETALGLAPAYFGTPMDSAAQLGLVVASDPRFEMCTVERTTKRLWGRDAEPDELSQLAGLRDEMMAQDFRYKALLRAIVATDAYRAGGVTGDATDAERASARTLRHLSPLTLASVIEDLTGFRWKYRSWDELDSDETGYRVLLGGADGLTVREPNLEPSVSRSLVLRRLAEAAADSVAAHDFSVPRDGRRLIGTTVDDLPTTDAGALAAEIAAVHLRILGRAPTDAEALELATFYEDAARATDARTAWAGLVGALLRDPGFWTY